MARNRKKKKAMQQNELHRQLILKGGNGAGKHHNRTKEVRTGRRRTPKHRHRCEASAPSSDHSFHMIETLFETYFL